MNNDFMSGYLKALADFEDLLDNAVSNCSGDNAPQHYDYELRDQLIMLRGNVYRYEEGKTV